MDLGDEGREGGVLDASGRCVGRSRQITRSLMAAFRGRHAAEEADRPHLLGHADQPVDRAVVLDMGSAHANAAQRHDAVARDVQPGSFATEDEGGERREELQEAEDEGGDGDRVGGEGGVVGAVRLWDKGAILLRVRDGEVGEFELPEALRKISFTMRYITCTNRTLGGAISPDNSWYALQGLDTLALRMEKHCNLTKQK